MTSSGGDKKIIREKWDTYGTHDHVYGSYPYHGKPGRHGDEHHVKASHGDPFDKKSVLNSNIRMLLSEDLPLPLDWINAADRTLQDENLKHYYHHGSYPYGGAKGVYGVKNAEDKYQRSDDTSKNRDHNYLAATEPDKYTTPNVHSSRTPDVRDLGIIDGENISGINLRGPNSPV